MDSSALPRQLVVHQEGNLGHFDLATKSGTQDTSRKWATNRFGTVFQNGYAVRDPNTGIAHFGGGPFPSNAIPFELR